MTDKTTTTDPDDYRDLTMTALPLSDIYGPIAGTLADYGAAPSPAPAAPSAAQPLQERVREWMIACFGPDSLDDKLERSHRFLEEAFELAQACGCTFGEAHQLVDYVFGRPVGEPFKEVGGVLVTLAALCGAQGIDMDAAGDAEVARIWTKADAIRAKREARPKDSPLPGYSAPQPAQGGSVSELVQAATALRTMVKVTRCPVFPEEIEAVAIVERFDAALSAARAAQSVGEVASVLWCVHHIGPDDLHPVEDYEAAVKMADAINDQSEKFNFGHKPDSINYVYSRAYPAIWTGTPESHAEWLEKRRAAALRSGEGR